MVNLNRIFKYEIPMCESYDLKLKVGSKILSAVNQYDKIVLYAMVPQIDVVYFDHYEILVKGTGWEMPERQVLGFEFIGTVSLYNGEGMFHIFYKKVGMCYER